jgi:hypothetical protein
MQTEASKQRNMHEKVVRSQFHTIDPTFFTNGGQRLIKEQWIYGSDPFCIGSYIPLFLTLS